MIYNWQTELKSTAWLSCTILWVRIVKITKVDMLRQANPFIDVESGAQWWNLLGKRMWMDWFCDKLIRSPEIPMGHLNLYMPINDYHSKNSVSTIMSQTNWYFFWFSFPLMSNSSKKNPPEILFSFQISSGDSLTISTNWKTSGLNEQK